MVNSIAAGRSVIKRGNFSLYLGIDEDWLTAAGTGPDSVFRLGIRNIEDSSMTVRLHIDQDYCETTLGPGAYDIDIVNIQTSLEWCLPADIRNKYGITNQFRWNAEFTGEYVDYELVSPTIQEQYRLS
ncbi:hypothetical protein [Haloarcula marismortui]|uniref:Uncharacterized protein n=1 Tax=Haloarcula marismortui ATCC 33800 TaxID=662476 RepID=M0JKX0_9EURY|nr:hypothetical protein [Haloarcula sinaiiensis]EMA09792.1 hypothetical protein C436_18736 [Haloarcula sinaiiensis ATCC 33800]QUJ74735.1 hypothetical protein KDQ40_20985 [Haloarcula sinaiiensis ATCC 33800]